MLVLATDEADGTVLTITDSLFTAFDNAGVTISGAKLIVKNTTFSNFLLDSTPFFSIFNNVGPEQGVFLEDVTVEYLEPKQLCFKFDRQAQLHYKSPEMSTNFMTLVSCTIDITFQSLTVREVTVSNGCPFVAFTSDFEDPNSPTTFTINDTTLEYIYERASKWSSDYGLGLMFDITGTSLLNINRFYSNNVRIKCKNSHPYRFVLYFY